MRRLKRADLPIDTAALARYLIGKTLVRDAPEGRTSGRMRRDRGTPRVDGSSVRI